MTELGTQEPGVIDESVLRRLEADQKRHAELADVYQARVDWDAQQAAQLAVVREFLAPRVGMPWEDVQAEAEAELQKAEAAAAEALAEAERLREEHRDLLGYKRVLQRRIAELEAQSGEDSP